MGGNILKRLFFVWIIILSQLTACSGGEVPVRVEPGINEFKDSDETFHVSVKGREELPAAPGIYEFIVRNDQNEIVTETRIVVTALDKKQTADLFAPGYEETFLSECRCAVTSRGVVLFEGQQARQYVVTVKNGEWVSYQRHFTRGPRTYILSVRGPAAFAEKIKETFETTIASFHFIPSHD